MGKKKNILLFNNDLASFSQEEFERICMNIEFLAYETRSQSLLITSANKNEGKTTITTNIAIALASTGKKVLLVDGNIRDPNLHKVFQLNNTVGLTNFLIGQKGLFEVMYETTLPNLNIMTAGPMPRHGENLLKSPIMDQFIRTASSHFDFVIFDSASVLDGNEAKIIGAKCDGVFLVIKNKSTEEDDAIHAKKMLEVAQAKLLGVIFNKS